MSTAVLWITLHVPLTALRALPWINACAISGRMIANTIAGAITGAVSS